MQTTLDVFQLWLKPVSVATSTTSEQSKRTGPRLALILLPTSWAVQYRSIPPRLLLYVYVCALQRQQLCGCGSGVPELSRLGEPFQKRTGSN